MRRSLKKAQHLNLRRFAGQAVIPMCVFALGLVAVFAPPSEPANGALLLVVLGLVVPVMALWLLKDGTHHMIGEPGLQLLDVARVSGGLRRRRGPRRRDEGRR